MGPWLNATDDGELCIIRAGVIGASMGPWLNATDDYLSDRLIISARELQWGRG